MSLYKMTRCEKNIIRGRTLDMLSEEIESYIRLKTLMAASDDEKDKAEYHKEIVELDEEMSDKAFRYGMAAESVFAGLNYAFDVLEKISDASEQKENDNGNAG